jgi:lysozyme family protein
MTTLNFPAWFDWMEQAFEGQSLHTTPKDPGGATAFGWTYGTWEGFAKLHGLDPSFEHFAAMQRDDFKTPSRLAFWNAVKADQLPAGVDVIWCDFQFGSYHATEVLQGLIGVPADNAVGNVTINKAWSFNNKAKLLDDMTAARKAYYQTLTAYEDFGRGWDRRADECMALAYGICKLSVPAPVVAANQVTTGDGT